MSEQEQVSNCVLRDLVKIYSHATTLISRETAAALRELLERRAADQWQDAPAEDGWYWCEALEADLPPQLLRSYQPMRYVPDHAMYVVDFDAPRKWQRWMGFGWVDLVGRVSRFRRPV